MLTRAPVALACTIAVLALAIGGTPHAQDDDFVQEPIEGPWRARLASPGGELPFELSIERDDEGGWRATIVNGPERIEVPEVGIDDRSFVLSMPHYDSRLVAEVRGGGRVMSGYWEKRSGPDSMTRMRFGAEAGSAPRFGPSGNASQRDSVAGRWSVLFESSPEIPAVAIFERTDGGDEVTGTFLTTTGDYRYLAGSQEGARLRLSCFDGAHAFLFSATVDASGELRGDFWSRDTWHETWHAIRDPQATLPDAFGETRWDEGTGLAELVFSDLSGRARSLADPEFAGRARLLVVFGSWCPNCHDEARYLAELERRYGPQGLAILGLAFELTGEFKRDSEQVQRFAARHGLDYPMLLCGRADKALATEALGSLDRVRSFPTTIFLHGDGRVAAVHSGFAGPGTGAEHDALRAEFEGLIETLLAEPETTHDETWAWLAERFFVRKSLRWAASVEFQDVAGRRTARVQRHASDGNTQTEMLPVVFNADGVAFGDELLRIDRRAGVLLDPTDVGRRFSSDPASVAPLLADLPREGRDAALVERLASADPLLRREALIALVDERVSRRKSGAPEVVPLLDDDDPEVRASAAWAAGVLREASAAGRLVEMLKGVEPRQRREAAAALVPLTGMDSSLKGVLSDYRDDPDPLVREAIAGRPARDDPQER